MTGETAMIQKLKAAFETHGEVHGYGNPIARMLKDEIAHLESGAAGGTVEGSDRQVLWAEEHYGIALGHIRARRSLAGVGELDAGFGTLTLRGEPVPAEVVEAAEFAKAQPDETFAAFGHKFYWVVERAGRLGDADFARFRAWLVHEGGGRQGFWDMLRYNIDAAYCWLVVNGETKHADPLWNMGVDGLEQWRRDEMLRPEPHAEPEKDESLRLLPANEVAAAWPAEWTGKGRPQIAGGPHGEHGRRFRSPYIEERAGHVVLGWGDRGTGACDVTIEWQPMAGESWRESDGGPVEPRVLRVSAATLGAVQEARRP